MRSYFFSIVCTWFIITFVIPPPDAVSDSRLAGVTSFAYQLQSINLEELRSSDIDLFIIDYSSEGDNDTAFTADEIESLKDDHTVVSYLSIGEAEDYRFYFRKRWTRRVPGAICDTRLARRAPVWLDFPNEDWCGNYKVRYWNRNWKKKLFGRSSGRKKSYLDRIIDAGFQGVYLDIIDGYEYWKYDVRKKRRRKSAARDMAMLVIELARYAREERGQGDFIVIPQNGSGILSEISDELKQQYLDAIDAIGAEDTFFYGEKDENNPYEPRQETLDALNEFLEAGKPVLATDYLTEEDKVSLFQTEACDAGYLPQVATRELDNLGAETLRGCPI